MGGSNVVNAMSYDEFGVPVAKITIPRPFGFTGYQTESIAGSYYAQARYYLPTLGRFGAEDLIRDGQNWYDYCHSNPLILTDLNGLNPHLRVDEGTRYPGIWLVDPVVYALAMGASYARINTFVYNPGFLRRYINVPYSATIIYNNHTWRFDVDASGRIDYSEINNALGWNNAWIPNNRTYQAFLGSHPVAGTHWHHSSVLVFALPGCRYI